MFHQGGGRAGWYLQQFLKLAWAYQTKDPYYLVLDADTIPLNHLDFISDNGKFLFTKKIEYNKPYFDTIGNIFGSKLYKKADFSFVAEHMIFSSCYVKEMLYMITENNLLKGESFWEKILYAIKIDDIKKAGFSEFETYGNYMFLYHPDLIDFRSLRTEREAVYLIGSHPSEQLLKWASVDYDIISIEINDYYHTPMIVLTSIPLVRKMFHLKTLSTIRRKIRSVYRKVLKKNDFKFEN